MRVVMIEPDIMVDKRGRPELQVLFDSEECDRVLEDCGIEVVGSVQRKTVKTDGDMCGDDGSHVQEAFGRQLKMEGLKYPGNDPKWIMPLSNSSCGRKKHAMAKRSRLRRIDPCCGAAL